MSSLPSRCIVTCSAGVSWPCRIRHNTRRIPTGGRKIDEDNPDVPARPCCCPAPAVAQDLPTYMRADKYLLEATRAMEGDDRQEALRAFEKYEAMDVEPTPSFAYLYGKALVEHGSGAEAWRKGQSLLTQFVIAAGRDSEDYTTILELLLTAESKLDASERQETLDERLPGHTELDGRADGPRRGRVVHHGLHARAAHVCGRRRADAPGGGPQLRDQRVRDHPGTVGSRSWARTRAPSRIAPSARSKRSVGDDIQAFLGRLNAAGGRFRLPSEAEW